MWNIVCNCSFIYIVIFLSNAYSTSTSFLKKSSIKDSYTINDRSKRSTNKDVLWDVEPPTIVEELPKSVAFFSNGVLKLQCNIRGYPMPTYQWYLSTNDKDEKFEKVMSATDKKLEIDGRQSPKTYFKHKYFCSAQNSLGTLYSNKIIVEKVQKPLHIGVKYITHSIILNEKFVVKCTLIPDLTPIYKFKHWEVRLGPGKLLTLNKTIGRFSIIESTKYPQLHIRNITDEDFSGTKVRCIFESTIEQHDAVVSSIFQSIEKYSYEYIPHLTKVIFSGETITAYVGNNVELPWSCVPKTDYVSWYKILNSEPINTMKIGDKDDTKFVMVSRRYGNLMIMNVTKEDSGKYLVRSIDKRLSETFTLNVYDIPSISLTPKDIRKKVSESAEFTCRATFLKCQFRWLHNGQSVVTGYDDGNVEITSVDNTSVLRVKKVRISVSGIFQCIAISVDDFSGITDSRQISGTILLSEVPPVLVRQSPRTENNSSTAHIQMSKKDNFLNIECTFAANPSSNINWYHDSNPMPLINAISIDIQKDQNSIYNTIAKLTFDLNEISDEDMERYAGEYQAKAVNSLGSTSCNTFVLMDGSPEIRLPGRQTAVGDKDYVMTCYFKAMGVPEFFWDRKIGNSQIWESLPFNHRTQLKDKGHKLLLVSVIKKEDEGIYRCTIKYNKEKKEGTTNLIVAYPPLLKALPSKHDSTQSQTHICTIRSEADKPWYAWWTFTRYNTNVTVEINPSMKDPLYNVYYPKADGSAQHLLPGLPQFLVKYPNLGVDIIINARSHDKDIFGKFVCHVRNHIGSDEQIIEDTFLRLEFKIIPPSSSEVVVGGDLYLNCTAEESDLKPIVKWRLSQDTKYTDINDVTEYKNRIFQYDNGTLVMNNIRESDPSKLLCFLIPTGHSDLVRSKISYIEIRVPARILRFEPNIFKVAGKPFNLSCDVFGHTQDMMVNWYQKSSLYSSWETFYEACISSNEHLCLNRYSSNPGTFTPIIINNNKTHTTVHLQFSEAMESMSSQYKCKARNKYNEEFDETITTLTIISKPSAVIIDHTMKDTGSTSLTVYWKPPENNGNRPIIRYVIKCQEITRTVPNFDYKNFSQKTFQVNESIHSLVIENLRPFKKYMVTVEAENEVGVSDPSQVLLVTQEEKPQRPVNNLVACSTKPDEIFTSWDDPDIDYQNGHIVKYQMCYQIITPGADPRTIVQLDKLQWPSSNEDIDNFPSVKCNNAKVKTFTVSHLPQFTDFAIRVIAFNSKGASPPLYTKVRTLEDLPQAPPTSVKCEVYHQSLNLWWNPPGIQTINGVLIGYQVYYYKPNKYGDESHMKTIIVQGQTNVLLNNLKPYTSYSIQVMAVNRKGLGPPSGSVVCTTKEAKPEAPESVKAIKINDTCLCVSWLHVLNPNGPIRKYCVILQEFFKCQSPDMTKRYNTMIICGRNNQIDHVKVLAQNIYNGTFKDVSQVDDRNSIISFGDEISVKKGSTIILPCESRPVKYNDVMWKKDGQDIYEGSDPKFHILKNFSLKISDIDSSYVFTCFIESDSIDYRLNIEETSDGIPKTPIIDLNRVTENSIYIRWKSQGTTDMAVPITGFIIAWENRYNKDTKTVYLDEKARSFYLNNVTCASEFFIKLCSQSGTGKSRFSEPLLLRTRGTAPLIPDGNMLLPLKNIDANNANFNLLAFLPGENCSAINFNIQIFLTSEGQEDRTNLILNKNISVYELENKCCFKVTGLNPWTTHRYEITASNPGGPTVSAGSFQTTSVIVNPTVRNQQVSNNNLASQSWLLMIVLVIVIILVLIFVIVGVLYILRSKEKNAKPIVNKVVARKSDYNQNRVEKPGNHDDTASMDSEPSPYAVYQPDTDQKHGPLISHQISQQSSTSQYNYPDHHYNQIRYDMVPGRLQMALDNHRDIYRRANSAECLSSLGNASVTGIADLESPSNIDPNNTQEYFRAPFNHCADTDEVFQNIRIQEFSTMNRKKMRRENEIMNRFNEEENARLMNNRSKYYEPNNPRHQPLQQQMNPSISRNANQRLTYCQQMSMPEPSVMYQSQHAYPSNRVRTASGSGRTHPSSQTIQSNNPGSSAQVSGYGSYYGHRVNNVQPYSSTSGVRRDEPPRNLYSSYIPGSNLSNYNPPQRTALASRPAMESIDSPDEGIYTDRVIVV